MARLVLVIGNKNYSSWSMRPWILLKAAGIPFEEVMIPLQQPDTAARIAEHTPAGRLPVLKHGGITVWESLAICEYLAEQFPDAALWPADTAARAMARAIANEMHAGFQPLRQAMPMNVRRDRPGLAISPEVAANIARIGAIWREARTRFGERPDSGGPFLFGRFSVADAMFAPVISRFRTYHVDPGPVARGYMDAFWRHPAARAWLAESEAEGWPTPFYDDV